MTLEKVDYVSLKQVCTIYGKTATQVRYAVTTGRLTAEKTVGGWELHFPVKSLPSEWPEPPRKQKREVVSQ